GARAVSRVARSRGVDVAPLGARSVRARLARRDRGSAGGAHRARGAASCGARRQGLRRGRPPARRDRRGRLGGAPRRRASRLPPRPSLVTRELVYGRRPVREALRGPREVLELWAGERAVKSEPWLREIERPRVQTKLERDLSEAAGTRDHQGV